MTFGERVAALEPLGFSQRQTEFLVTVALHSGFCLRRHYMAFAGLKYGGGVREFLDRLVARGLARRSQFRADRGHVYHLHNSHIYAAINQNDNRNRRRTSPALIARKLMLLDYVIGEPSVDWYATEQDKVALFTTRFDIAPVYFPQRVYLARRLDEPNTSRYFIQKLPIFVTGKPPVVSFVFLATDTTGHGFSQFLQEHLRLLNWLPAWRIVAVAAKDLRGLPACTTALRRFVEALRTPRAPGEVAALHAHFDLRDRIDRKDLRDVTVRQIDEWRKSRGQFESPELCELYSRWKAGGPEALSDRRGGPFLAALAAGRGQLVTHQLPVGYDRFGTRPGVS
jgi:hypothetical protein